MAYRKTMIYSGAMLEIKRIHVGDNGKPIRHARGMLTCAAMQKKNLQRSQQHLMRLMCQNFKRGDYHITLTFSHMLPAEERKKAWQKFIRKLRRMCLGRTGQELKYICVLETGAQRPHYHLVCNAFPLDIAGELQEMWQYGTADFGPLDGCPDYGWMARYLTKQDEKDKNKKRWYQSKNLVDPEDYAKVRELKGDRAHKRLTAPKDYYELSHYYQATNDGYEWEYIIAIRQDRRQLMPEELRHRMDASDTWAIWAAAEEE